MLDLEGLSLYSDLTSIGNQDTEIPTMFINSSSSCSTRGHAEEIRFFSKKMIVQSHQQNEGDTQWFSSWVRRIYVSP